ncbi:MAG: DUF1934 domain-containing protein [Oscillospiraceae bacterium]|jgi:uncharacterized beta-barrel protein YwiB (DUF1934 family)|nr:DUF1934 domain-containing protein [Oscillospiraceae bacterium]
MNDNYTITINGEQFSPGEDTESFTLITDGEFDPGETARISYTDSEAVGADEPFETTFLVGPKRIVLKRGVWLGADMVFDEAEKSHFLYQTPYGALTMGVETEYISRNLHERGGDVHIKYALDVDNVVVSRNTFKISVQPS